MGENLPRAGQAPPGPFWLLRLPPPGNSGRAGRGENDTIRAVAHQERGVRRQESAPARSPREPLLYMASSEGDYTCSRQVSPNEGRDWHLRGRAGLRSTRPCAVAAAAETDN